MSNLQNVKSGGEKLPWKKPMLEEVPAKLYHALWLAAQGYRVAPITPNAKAPALIQEWQIAATRDEAQIRTWWTEWPEANIACPADDGLRVDIDPRHGGDVMWELLQMEHEIPATRAVRTASGGLHYYFRLPEGVKLKQSLTNALGQGIDTKAHAGGYVLAPGSTIDGNEYTWIDQRPPVMAPQWMIDRIGQGRDRDPDAGKRIVEEDDAAIYQCEAFLNKQPEDSVLEGDRDFSAYKVAATFYDFGVQHATCLEYLARWNEKCCVPPMASDQVEKCARSGGTSRQTAIGSKHPTVLAEEWKDIQNEIMTEWETSMTSAMWADHYRRQAQIDAMEEVANEKAKEAAELDDAPKSPALVWLDMSNWDRTPIPERRWAILNRVPLKQAGLFSGEGGTGKSIIELMKNVAHVLGQSWLDGVPIPVHGPAFYLGAEDDADELHIRLAAIAKHFGVSFSDLIKGGLYATSLLGQDATLCYLSGKSGRVETTKLYAELYERAGDLKPINISIDTLSRAFAGNEIDRVQVYAFAQHMQALAMVAESSVTILSHPSLSGQNSGSGLSGSTAWHGAFRFRQYLRAPTNDEADAVDRPKSDLRLLEFKKNQYGPIGQSITLHYADGLFLPVKEPTEFEQAAHAEAVDAIFLKMLERFTHEGRPVSEKGRSTNYAPAAFANEMDANFIDKDKFAAAMRRLFAAEKIHVEAYGPPSRGWTKLVAGKRS
jgi:RecA-family ATPase